MIELDNKGTTGKELACSSFAHCAPYYIIRKQLLIDNHLSFKEGILHEDSLFTPVFVLHCNRVQRYPHPVYHHFQRTGSITQTVNPKRVKDLLYVTTSLLGYGKALDEKIKYKWGNCVVQITNGLLLCTKSCDDLEVKQEVKRFVNSQPELLDYLGHSSLNNRVMALTSRVLRGRLYEVYSILSKLRY